MDCIKNLLLPHIQEIEAGEEVNVTLIYKMYEIINKFLGDVTHMNFGGPNSKLAIIGGIMINCDGDGTDHFLPLKFVVKDKSGGEVSYFDECFGSLKTASLASARITD